ncbi:GAF domain-containing protein [Erythrobacter sp. SCSIO 43205]|uniref:HWE histidine kinase domain-containing protein n=1 Tax=Erythrobacter sp. SCSIO 43205 TaxID=2779361 RepID=UPI001CA7BCC1|nr:HWE histidine kinase domain-containing protein [Erythrobacter sp. SCSIO 43205]UAB78797.1 GAF domain-containing protein [Erythrobacter sp. SCSIO 43205]
MNIHAHPQALTECDREAIHQIGFVQSFGALIAVDKDWQITHYSENASDILKSERAVGVGDPLSDHLTGKAVETLREALHKIAEDDANERVFGLKLTDGDALYDCAIHPSGDRIIIEFEPHQSASFRDHLAAIAPMTDAIASASDVDGLCQSTASLVRSALGYDRVMIYRFHRDHSGEVVAEDRIDELDSFVGLRYPHTDIPMQARELFKRNRFRIIADVNAPSAAIEPSPGAGNQPLDLSLSVLRASSEIHLQYLRNMGVAASLTIAIVRAGRLWGLISCHHNTPKMIPFTQRTVAEVISQVFSLMLDRLLVERSEQLRVRSLALHEKLMRRFADGVSFVEDLDMFEQVIAEMIPHDGTSVLIHDQYRRRGSAPDEAQFKRLLPRLSAMHESSVLTTNRLSARVDEAREFADVAAGALVLPISRSPRDYLVLWRKPLTQTVLWGGNPAKAVTPGKDRLEPRSSFKAWAETVEGLSDEWSDDELTIAESLRSTLLEVILRMTDEVAQERQRAQEKQDLLIAELNHRVRNILNLIRALVSQSSKDAASVSDFASIIGGRIAALASAHDNITRQQWAPAPIADLFETELEAYVADKNDRLRLTGEAALVQPEAYTVLALVVHELVTNSAKYGSLCDSTGTINVDISKASNGDLLINWTEVGGPPVQPPTRKGFGSTIIQRAIPYDLRGEAELNFKLSGVEASFRIPARYVAAPELALAANDIGDADNIALGEADDARALPRHVLVVEDNMIIALDAEDSLLELGVESVQVESSVAAALSAIKEREPDFAVVDFNLGVESSGPVARELVTRGVRFVLATGYSELSSDLDTMGASGLIRKPYGSAELKAALLGELGNDGAQLTA